MTKSPKNAKLKEKLAINLKTMDIKHKSEYLWVAAAILALAVIWWVKNANFGKQPNTTDETAQTQDTNVPTEQEQPQVNVWEGTLAESDNLEKGNLELKMATQTIYIKTSRNFSQLIGKQVQVTYQGTLQNFMLGDITLTEQK